MFEETARAIDLVKQERDNLAKTLSEIDKDKLSLHELKTYAEILKVVSEIQIGNYFDKLTEMFKSNAGVCASYSAPTIKNMKGEKEDGM